MPCKLEQIDKLNIINISMSKNAMSLVFGNILTGSDQLLALICLWEIIPELCREYCTLLLLKCFIYISAHFIWIKIYVNFQNEWWNLHVTYLVLYIYNQSIRSNVYAYWIIIQYAIKTKKKKKKLKKLNR